MKMRFFLIIMLFFTSCRYQKNIGVSYFDILDVEMYLLSKTETIDGRILTLSDSFKISQTYCILLKPQLFFYSSGVRKKGYNGPVVKVKKITLSIQNNENDFLFSEQKEFLFCKKSDIRLYANLNRYNFFSYDKSNVTYFDNENDLKKYIEKERLSKKPQKVPYQSFSDLNILLKTFNEEKDNPMRDIPNIIYIINPIENNNISEWKKVYLKVEFIDGSSIKKQKNIYFE